MKLDKKKRLGSRISARRGFLLDDNDANEDVGNFQGLPKTIYEYLKDLSEKRKSDREQAVSYILKALTDNIEQEFVEKNFVTLLYHCLHCVKKGSAKEVEEAAYIVGLLAMITTYDNDAHEAYEALCNVLNSELKTFKILDCLAVVTFFGASNSDETEQAMQLLWKFIYPESHSGKQRKDSQAVLTAAISAWTFLLTTIDGWNLSYKTWQGAISCFLNLLNNRDETVCAAAGEALAVIFETNCLEKFSEPKDTNGSIPEVKDNIIKQLRSQFTKTSGENIPNQDTRKRFNAVLAALDFLEKGKCLDAHVSIGGEKLSFKTWSQMIQLKFMKNFLGKDGFLKHMKKNENLHNVFEFMPKTRNSSDSILYIPEREEVSIRFFLPPIPRPDGSLLPFISRGEKQRIKKMFMSPSSYLNKAKTQLLKKQREASNYC